MKFKHIFFLGVFSFQSSLALSQSPVKWINNSFTINFDTNYQADFYYTYDILYENTLYKKYPTYKFKNIGDNVTFIDTSSPCDKFITKPNEYSIIELKSLINRQSLKQQEDITNSIILPFYYEGDIYKEKVIYNLTFGKYKLIEFGKLKVDVTDTISKLIFYDSIRKFPRVKSFTLYIKVKNIYTKPIYCTEKIDFWNDVSFYMNRGHYVIIFPGESYKIPVNMNMYHKYNFRCFALIEVFSLDMYEIYEYNVFSNFIYKN